MEKIVDSIRYQLNSFIRCYKGEDMWRLGEYNTVDYPKLESNQMMYKFSINPFSKQSDDEAQYFNAYYDADDTHEYKWDNVVSQRYTFFGSDVWVVVTFEHDIETVGKKVRHYLLSGFALPNNTKYSTSNADVNASYNAVYYFGEDATDILIGSTFGGTDRTITVYCKATTAPKITVGSTVTEYNMPVYYYYPVGADYSSWASAFPEGSIGEAVNFNDCDLSYDAIKEEKAGGTFDGNSYYDLGIDIQQPMSISIPVSQPSSACWLYGMDDDVLGADYRFCSVYGDTGYFYLDVGSERLTPRTEASYPTTPISLYAGINGTTATAKVYDSQSEKTVTFIDSSQGSFPIGTVLTTKGMSSSMWNGDIYNFEIERDGTTYHYIFCKRFNCGETVYIYCVEEDEFYENKGTGTVTVIEG